MNGILIGGILTVLAICCVVIGVLFVRPTKSVQATVVDVHRETSINKTFRSIGAVVAGFVVVAVLSTGTDFVLESLGIFTPASQGLFTLWMIVFAIIYRSLFVAVGAYVTARLAPSRPMRHAVILGIVGTVMATLAAIAAIPQNLSPAWFPIVLIITALPCAWLGGKLFEMKKGRA